MELILASTSSARVELLRSLGLPFQAVAPGVDEEVPEGTPVQRTVELLAERKARAVAERFPQALVIGADQLVCVDQKPLGKPADREAARRQLQLLSGRTHELMTGLCVVGPGYYCCEVDVARLELYALSSQELERYLDLEEWRGCAGGYRVEGAGQGLFSSLEGDRTSVQGLPMVRLVRMLRAAGVELFVRPR